MALASCSRAERWRAAAQLLEEAQERCLRVAEHRLAIVVAVATAVALPVSFAVAALVIGTTTQCIVGYSAGLCIMPCRRPERKLTSFPGTQPRVLRRPTSAGYSSARPAKVLAACGRADEAAKVLSALEDAARADTLQPLLLLWLSLAEKELIGLKNEPDCVTFNTAMRACSTAP